MSDSSGDLVNNWLQYEAAEEAELARTPQGQHDPDAGNSVPSWAGHGDGAADPRDASRADVGDLSSDEYLAVLEATQNMLIEAGMDRHLVPTGDAYERSEQRRIVDSYAREALGRAVSTFSISVTTRENLVDDLINDIAGLGPIEYLVQDPAVTEVIVRGATHTTCERAGRLEDVTCRWRSDDHVRAVAQRIAGRIGRKVDESDPMCDARLPDGSRVNIIMPPVSLIGPIITIRKFQPKGYTLEDLMGFGALNAEMRDLLVDAVEARVNILVSGSTGSGKTTLLKALAYRIPAHEYIITIEDTDELRLKDVHPRVSPLEARPSNSAGVGEVSIRRLLRNSLRMRPDRIVVGECRGAEALDMLQAMNTGHEGSLTTCHANSVKDAVLSRVPTMAAMSDEVDLESATLQTLGAVELGVQVVRDADGRRFVSAIVSVDPTDDPFRPALCELWVAQDDDWVNLAPLDGRVAKKLAAYQRRRSTSPQAQPVTEHTS